MVVIGTPVSVSSGVIDVTTLTRVKAFLQLGSETMYDAFLTSSIQSVSQRFQRYMNRFLTQTARVEYFDVASNQAVFLPKALPVISVTDVRNDSDRVFGTDTIVSANEYSVLDSELMFVDGISLSPGYKTLRLDYVGGMAPNTTDFVTAFADIAEAADKQVAFIHKRRKTIENESLSTDQGNVGLGAWDLLPDVKETLDFYKRITLGN